MQVALGAATFTIVSAHGFTHGDPGRIAANVASGVGFIGAGVITQAKRQNSGSNDVDADVRGLTTAAAIWITAGLGMACGAGLYFTSFIGTIITVLVLRMSDVKRSLGKNVSCIITALLHEALLAPPYAAEVLVHSALL